MKLTINGKTVDADPDQLTNKELMAVEKATGLDFEDFQTKLQKSSMLAVTALVWIVLRRDEPGLRFDDVDFKIGEMEVEASPDEYRAALAQKTGADRDAFIAALPAEMRDAVLDPTEGLSAAG